MGKGQSWVSHREVLDNRVESAQQILTPTKGPRAGLGVSISASSFSSGRKRQGAWLVLGEEKTDAEEHE